MMTEDPNFAYEYYMRERGGEETKLTKGDYEATYNAMASGNPNALIAIGDNLYSVSNIAKLFVLKNRRWTTQSK